MNIGLHSLPVRIVVDLTRKCNFHCYYCHSTSGLDYSGPELETKKVVSLLEAAEKMQVFDVTLTGGEPLLWPGLPKILTFSKNLNYPSLQLITNGSLISKDFRLLLKKSKVARICVSLDGVGSVNDRHRGTGSFKKIIGGIKRLRESFGNITVITVLDADNYSFWPDLTELLIKLKIRRQDLAPVCFAGRAQNEYRGLSEGHFRKLIKMVGRVKNHLPSWFELRFNDILVNPSLLTEEKPLSLSDFTERYKGWQVIIRPNGDIMYSVSYWGRFWRRNEYLGNINKDKIEEVWRRTSKLRIRLVKEANPEEEIGYKFQLKYSKSRRHIGRETQLFSDSPKLNPSLFSSIKSSYHDCPDTFRLRGEWFGGLLFDCVNFKICRLNHSEMKEIKTTKEL